MEKKIKLVREEDIIPTIFERRTSARLITKEREGSEYCSLHICRNHAFSQWTKDVKYPDADEIIYNIMGEAELIFDGEVHDFPIGAAMYIPMGQTYRMLCKTDGVVLVVKAPPTLRSEWATRVEGNPQRQDLVLLEPEDAVRKK